MKFFTGDWLKDPALTICTPATRGVWIDLLSAMHESDRSGKLCGTRDQLARLARCSTVELTQALTEIQTLRVAELQERNGVVTVTNRRMEREYNDRNNTRLRVSRFRSNDDVTPKKPPSNGVDPESDPEVQAKRESARRPALEDVKKRCEMAGYPVHEGEAFWNHFEASGWIDKNGHPIQKWEPKLASWMANARAKPAEAKHHNGASARALSPLDIRTIIGAKEKKADALKAKHSSLTATGHAWSDKRAFEEWRGIRKEIRDLNEKLSNLA